MPASVAHSSPKPKRSVRELLANPEFNAWNFVLALIGETSFALFFRITETLADYDRKIPIEEKIQYLLLQLLFAVCG